MKTEVLRIEEAFSPPYLNGLNIEIYSGEIVALLPIDYLGLDHLLNLILQNGSLQYGRFFFGGKKSKPSGIFAHKHNKVMLISQKDALAPALSVDENLFVIRSGYKSFLVNRRILNSQSRRVFEELGITLDGTAYVDSLTPCQKILLKLAKAYISGTRLVVMKNISDFVGDDERQKIIGVMKILSAKGMAFLYVCNHHQEAFAFCHRALLMKQGKIEKRLSPEMMTDAMIENYSYSFNRWTHGAEHTSLFRKEKGESGEGFFCRLNGIEFSLKKGETAILLDSDSRTISEIFSRLSNGKLTTKNARVSGNEWNPHSKKIAIIPAEPCEHLLFPQLSVLDNICFTLDGKVKNLWRTKTTRAAVAKELYSIFGDAIFAPSLEGLSQQLKYDIVYQRILFQHPEFVCVMQPLSSAAQLTRIRLLEYFDRFRKIGITVCIMAYSLSDCLEVSDRLLVIKGGKISGEYHRSEFAKYPGISGSRPTQLIINN